MLSEVPSERSADNRMLAGACRCGAVRYRVADACLYALVHCVLWRIANSIVGISTVAHPG
jgi:hypothetical protein